MQSVLMSLGSVFHQQLDGAWHRIPNNHTTAQVYCKLGLTFSLTPVSSTLLHMAVLFLHIVCFSLASQNPGHCSDSAFLMPGFGQPQKSCLTVDIPVFY